MIVTELMAGGTLWRALKTGKVTFYRRCRRLHFGSCLLWLSCCIRLRAAAAETRLQSSCPLCAAAPQ